MRIPLAMPAIGELEIEHVTNAISSGWLSGTGPCVASFETALSRQLGRRHVVAVSSGTVALELALLALGIGPGDEVIVPALTFAAPAAAVRAVGAEVVLADVSEGTWTIDPDSAAALINDRTRAIIAVDVMGHPCDFDSLMQLGVPIIEDAAEAHGSSYKGEQTGRFGLMSVFSFHANKCITTGEGGCVATDDAVLADAIRVRANHGMRPERPYYHEVVGRSARMANLTAAVGVAQVGRWEQLVEARRTVGKLYLSALSEIGCPSRPEQSWADVVPWLQVAIVKERDAVIGVMRERGIDARPIWPALSDLPLYRSSARRPCPVASAISAVAAWLPTWAYMSEETVREVVAELAMARSQAGGKQAEGPGYA